MYVRKPEKLPAGTYVHISMCGKGTSVSCSTKQSYLLMYQLCFTVCLLCLLRRVVFVVANAEFVVSNGVPVARLIHAVLVVSHAVSVVPNVVPIVPNTHVRTYCCP